MWLLWLFFPTWKVSGLAEVVLPGRQSSGVSSVARQLWYRVVFWFCKSRHKNITVYFSKLWWKHITNENVRRGLTDGWVHQVPCPSESWWWVFWRLTLQRLHPLPRPSCRQTWKTSGPIVDVQTSLQLRCSLLPWELLLEAKMNIHLKV